MGQDPSTLNLGAVITAGGLAGVAMWSIAIPPDVRNESFASGIVVKFALTSCQYLHTMFLGNQIAYSIGPPRHI